mmetsp:Transcript_76592/g.185051  ORF Transcript_76592/g.185051 Transcript_76592/m.185051 type:complete len:305 (+) Transcript_76592:448-1362(+)
MGRAGRHGIRTERHALQRPLGLRADPRRPRRLHGGAPRPPAARHRLQATPRQPRAQPRATPPLARDGGIRWCRLPLARRPAARGLSPALDGQRHPRPPLPLRTPLRRPAALPPRPHDGGPPTRLAPRPSPGAPLPSRHCAARRRRWWRWRRQRWWRRAGASVHAGLRLHGAARARPRGGHRARLLPLRPLAAPVVRGGRGGRGRGCARRLRPALPAWRRLRRGWHLRGRGGGGRWAAPGQLAHRARPDRPPRRLRTRGRAADDLRRAAPPHAGGGTPRALQLPARRSLALGTGRECAVSGRERA